MDKGIPGPTAVLVWISSDKDRVPEMLELCSSAGYDIVVEVGQKKNDPDPRFYLGPGKLDEIGELDVEYIITVSDLTPSQAFGISHRSGKKVADRTRVILDLFRNHASSPEARMQVEIADLRYQLPVLKEYIHQGMLSERPGFMAGGEYAVNYYHDMIKRRMTSLKRKLEGERRRRGHKRALRRRKGAYLVSIAGYTNAGKSSLFNDLAGPKGEDGIAEVGGEMFTTISTTTRRMKGKRGCLVSDTVGFIRDLPPWLVEGFMSTLEEIFEADIVLLVIDGSEPVDMVMEKLSDSLKILRKGGTEGKIMMVINKVDLLQESLSGPELSEMIYERMADPQRKMVRSMVPISAMNGTGIDRLIETVEDLLPPLIEVSLKIPLSRKNDEMIASIRKHSIIRSENYEDGSLVLSAMMEERWVGHFNKRMGPAGGTLSVEEEAREIKP